MTQAVCYSNALNTFGIWLKTSLQTRTGLDRQAASFSLQHIVSWHTHFFQNSASSTMLSISTSSWEATWHPNLTGINCHNSISPKSNSVQRTSESNKSMLEVQPSTRARNQLDTMDSDSLTNPSPVHWSSLANPTFLALFAAMASRCMRTSSVCVVKQDRLCPWKSEMLLKSCCSMNDCRRCQRSVRHLLANFVTHKGLYKANRHLCSASQLLPMVLQNVYSFGLHTQTVAQIYQLQVVFGGDILNSNTGRGFCTKKRRCIIAPSLHVRFAPQQFCDQIFHCANAAALKTCDPIIKKQIATPRYPNPMKIVESADLEATTELLDQGVAVQHHTSANLQTHGWRSLVLLSFAPRGPEEGSGAHF